jgi:glycosyltransferase involved in cell wall biosynthesis
MNPKDTARDDRRLRVLFLSWRDEWHPEAGGSERSLSAIARGLSERGHDVTVATARYSGSRGVEVRDGVRYLRRGNRLTVYPFGFLRAILHRADAVVDVQNGIPFMAGLVRPRSTILLVHHVHREQWRVAVGPVAGRIGWFIESRVSPFVHRSSQHVAVSESTGLELIDLGHPARSISIIRNGSDAPRSRPERSDNPRLVVVSRLVPHKQVEHAIGCLRDLLPEFPTCRLAVVGDGYHLAELRDCATQMGVSDRVEFLGRVDDGTRDAELSRAWVHLLPSLKEGWGLAAVEAAACGTPTVAYRTAGGVVESVIDGETGFLVDSPRGLTEAARRLLRDRELAGRMAFSCEVHAAAHSWKAAIDNFEQALVDVARGVREAP